MPWCITTCAALLQGIDLLTYAYDMLFEEDHLFLGNATSSDDAAHVRACRQIRCCDLHHVGALRHVSAFDLECQGTSQVIKTDVYIRRFRQSKADIRCCS